jgi:hypothetical protein
MLALHSLLVLALLPTLPVSAQASAASSVSHSTRQLPRHPTPRTYATHTYYALELHPSTSVAAQDAAAHLGLELVEPLGELVNHYLARLAHDEHAKRGGEAGVKRSWKALRKRGEEGQAVRGLEMMAIKKRTKREWVDPLEEQFALRGDSTMSRRQDGDSTGDMTEFDFMVRSYIPQF